MLPVVVYDTNILQLHRVAAQASDVKEFTDALLNLKN